MLLDVSIALLLNNMPKAPNFLKGHKVDKGGVIAVAYFFIGYLLGTAVSKLLF